jgi:hypothetical protein
MALMCQGWEKFLFPMKPTDFTKLCSDEVSLFLLKNLTSGASVERDSSSGLSADVCGSKANPLTDAILKKVTWNIANSFMYSTLTDQILSGQLKSEPIY